MKIMNRSIILAHPFGNANVRQALRAFHEADLLETFITSISADHLRGVGFLPQSVRSEIKRRQFSDLSSDSIEPHPYLEGLRLLGKRLGSKVPSLSPLFPSADDVWASIDQALSNRVLKNDTPNLSIYAYEDGASKSFAAAKTAQKIYELPIGYWKCMHSILGYEKEVNPEWSITLQGLKDPQDKLERKEVELRLADKIVVPSSFVSETLPEIYRAKATTIPYGCPPPLAENPLAPSRNGALRVFFCGSLGQRKGISYLFDAVAKMGSAVELTVVGSMVAPCPALTRAMERTRWYQTVPREKVLELMRQSDVMVFPTLFEGRALVVLEALSQGLPVITTENSGTEDVVVDGKSGFLVPIRSVEEICAQLERIYHDRELLAHLKAGALSVAGQSGWDVYRRALVSAMQ
jgi:glycosyltransferase involved in cell wall biosynthesis